MVTARGPDISMHGCGHMGHIQHLQSSSVALGQGINYIPNHHSHSTWDCTTRSHIDDILGLACSMFHIHHQVIILLLPVYWWSDHFSVKQEPSGNTGQHVGLVSANKCQCYQLSLSWLTQLHCAREGRSWGRAAQVQSNNQPIQRPGGHSSTRPRTQKLVLVVVKVLAIPRWFYYNITHNDKPCQ